MLMRALFKQCISLLPYLFCFLFLLAFIILGFVRHDHYQSYGYDLGINDQTVWRYANFQSPISTIAPYSDKTKFAEHIELVFVLIAPFYWIWSSPLMLITLQAATLCASAIAVYLLAGKNKLPLFVRFVVMFAYLMFYGVQFALWTDVHSSVFATAFLMWFIYFLDVKKKKLTFLFFLLVLTAKESTGTTLFVISFVYFIYRREKTLLLYMGISVVYVLFTLFIFYPVIMHVPYLYANHNGLLSNINPISLIDSSENRSAIFYSFASWGFLPMLSPIMLLPIMSHFFKYFVIASDLSGAQGLYGHYRVILTPVLSLATIWSLKRFSIRLQTILGVFLLISVFVSQYFLHLPLSYLTKGWFWSTPIQTNSINTIIKNYLPANASVVSQNNITPHISQRDKIYTLYPVTKNFVSHSPCGKNSCNWFRWDGNPEYLLVDISRDWDVRHLLTDRTAYSNGLINLEKNRNIKKYMQRETTILYKIMKKP